MRIVYTLNFKADRAKAREAEFVVEQALASAKTILKEMSSKNALTWSKNIQINTKPIPDEDAA